MKKKEKKRANRETELDGAQGDDEDAEEDRNGAVAHDLGGGAHDAGLPRTHLVPAPCVEERFLKVPPFPPALFPETHRFAIDWSPCCVLRVRGNVAEGFPFSSSWIGAVHC